MSRGLDSASLGPCVFQSRKRGLNLDDNVHDINHIAVITLRWAERPLPLTYNNSCRNENDAKSTAICTGSQPTLRSVTSRREYPLANHNRCRSLCSTARPTRWSTFSRDAYALSSPSVFFTARRICNAYAQCAVYADFLYVRPSVRNSKLHVYYGVYTCIVSYCMAEQSAGDTNGTHQKMR